MTSGASTTLRGPTSRRGLTLVEMVISMVLVSVMLVAALHTVGASQLGQRKVHSRREGHLLAQDLVSEILWQEYADPVEGLDSFGLSAAEAATANRSLFDDVDDYDGWSASPPQDKTGTEYPNLDGWQRSVAVAWTDPTDFSQDVGDNQGAKRITVTVTQDGVVVAELVALKTIGLPALEACCLGDGTCADLRAQGCVAQGGTPQGAGTTCASTTCPTESLLFVSGGSLVALPEGDPILIPTAQEELRIALIESWDFSVGLIAASAAQSDFDAAVAESDVAYVSGAVAAASLGTKLTAAPIGVVSENAGMIPLLGLASDSFEIGNEDQLEILDDAHHITADIASPVTFSNVRLTVTVLHGGTLAPDLQNLAVSPAPCCGGDPALAVLEVGGITCDASLSAGRRAQLPFANADVSQMTADGQTLMQRAIEWAAEEVSGVETGDIYVNEIAMGGRKSGLFYYAQATVWIKDDTGADVAGATVVVQWSGAVGGQSEGQTGVDGKVMLESAGVKNGGTYTCTVSGVSKLGWTYNPGLNVETSDSIMLP